MIKGWETKILGDLLQKTETVNPLNSPETEFEYIDVSSVSNKTFQIDSTQVIKGKNAPSRAKKLVRKGDIIFATIRPTLKRIAIVPEHLDGQVCSTGYTVLRTKERIDHRFIFYFLFTETFSDAMERLQRGASYPAVTDGDVRGQEISVPPLAEQQRIVAKLDEAFVAIAKVTENVEKNVANARAIFESEMNAIFTTKGEGWKEVKLGNICERVSVGHVGPTSEFYCEENLGVPFLRSQNVRPGYIDWNGIKYVTREFHNKLRKSQLRNGDVLFVRVGANRGDCCSVPENSRESNCANIVFARPIKGNTKYIELYCNSAVGRSQLLGMTTGSAQGVINTKSVAELVIPMAPSNKQIEIVKKIERLREESGNLESTYKNKLGEIDELKRSLLQYAFTGQL